MQAEPGGEIVAVDRQDRGALQVVEFHPPSGSVHPLKGESEPPIHLTEKILCYSIKILNTQSNAPGPGPPPSRKGSTILG